MIAITDIILALSGLVAGFIGGRLSKQPPAPKSTMPPCSCGHTRGQHDKGRGKCQWTKYHSFNEYYERCNCQIWDGPERPEDIIRDFQG